MLRYESLLVFLLKYGTTKLGCLVLKKIELLNWVYSSSASVAYKWAFTVLIIIESL